MMLPVLLFVFGAWQVQQMAQLPSIVWIISAAIAGFLLLLTQWFSCFASFSQLVISHPIISHSAIFFKSRFLKLGLISLGAFLLGISWASGFALWRMSDALPHAWEQQTILLEGVVASVPELTERGERFRFDVEKIITLHAVVPKHISLNHYYAESDRSALALTSPLTKTSAETSSSVSQFHAGERWQISVRLKQPHGTLNPHGFDFEAWALSENIRATGSIKSKAGMKKLDNFVWQPSYAIEYIREQVKYRIALVLANQAYVGVIQALVMGDDSQISVNDWQVFLRTGTSHLMSISGLHITMLAGLAFGLVHAGWRRFPSLILKLPTRKAATLAGVLTACCYALVAGFSVPSQRTFYMLMVFAVALWSGRRLVIAQVLSAALLIVVLLDPWAVNAPGFWLSFGAVAMLSFALGGRVGQAHWFKVALHTQWAVTIGMLPLLLIMFNQASIISPIANAIAIPVISFVVTPLALLGSFLPFDAPLHLAYFCLNGLMRVLNWINQWPLVTWHQHAPPPWTLLPALIGVILLLLPRGFPMRWFGLMGFLPMLFILPVRPNVGDMKVTVLDVGQGLSVVVQTKNHTLLYDAGPRYSAQSDAGSRIVMPYLYGEGVNQLDGFIVSHNDADHSGGLNSILALMPVRWLASSFDVDASDLENINNADLKKIKCFAGQHWVWDQVHFEILYPNIEAYDDPKLKDNNRSCVLKVSSQAGSMLMTGDIEKEAERYLLSNEDSEKLKSDVMTVPHHGSKTSSTVDFLDAVAPKISVFTAGYLNRFGHPKPIVVERYQAINSQLYRSDDNGAMVFKYQQQPNATEKIAATAWRSEMRRYWLEVSEK